MRSVLILAALAGLPACLVSDYHNAVGDDDDDPDPPDPPRPDEVDLGMDRKVAAGTAEHYSRPFSFTAGSYAGVVLESSDPEMLEAHVIDEDHLGFVTHGPGTYTLSARRQGFPQILDVMTIEALPVEDIIFDRYTVDSTETATTKVAAMPGAFFGVCATYFGPGHDRIPGHGAFEATGGLVILNDDAPGMNDIYSTCLDLAVGDDVGPAELVASVEGGIARTLSVEVHDTVASGEIRFFALEGLTLVERAPMPGEFALARLIGRTPGGEHLIGVVAEWTPNPVFIQAEGEAASFIAGPTGTTVEVEATIGALVVRGSVTVQ